MTAHVYAHGHGLVLADGYRSSDNGRLRHALTEQEGCHEQAQEQSKALAEDTGHEIQSGSGQGICEVEPMLGPVPGYGVKRLSQACVNTSA